MRTLGHGKAEKEAVSGALQWSRGEAPNAALRLSPTFAADNGQRTKPQAASATINARANPHATARRMLSKSPYLASTNNSMRRLILRTGKHGDKPPKYQLRQRAPEAMTGGELAAAIS